MGCTTPQQQNLALYQGDDWAATVTVLNCDGSVPDLTGYTAQAQIREGGADQCWRISASLLCAVVPPNQISISLTSEQTTWLSQLSYYWDLQLTAPPPAGAEPGAFGAITTILAGQVNVTPEVTRVWERPVAEESLVWVRDPAWRPLYWTDEVRR